MTTMEVPEATAPPAVSGGGPGRRRGRRVFVGVLVVALLALGGVVSVSRLSRGYNAVVNSSGAVNLVGWQAASDAGEVGLQRFSVPDGPSGLTTTVDVRGAADRGTWAFAIAALKSPASYFQVGRTYRMSAWVRDLDSSGERVGMLLADANFQQRPSESTRYAAYSDRQWHLIERTFICTAPAGPDTHLYFELPTAGPLHVQITGAKLGQVDAVVPPHTGSSPARVVSFAGPAGAAPNPRDWNHEVGGNGWGNKEKQTYVDDPETAHIDADGHLVLTALRRRTTGVDGISRRYTSARLSTAGKVVVPPGSYVEAPLKLPVGDGVWPAFWLIGADVAQVGWPAAGELDVAEVSGNAPTVVHHAIHLGRAENPKVDFPIGDADGGATDLGEPLDAATHTYGVYFDGRVVRFYVDRRPALTYTAEDAEASGRTWPFNRPQYLVLDVAIGGHDAGDPALTSFPRHLTVGDISIWEGGVPF